MTLQLCMYTVRKVRLEKLGYAFIDVVLAFQHQPVSNPLDELDLHLGDQLPRDTKRGLVGCRIILANDQEYREVRTRSLKDTSVYLLLETVPRRPVVVKWSVHAVRKLRQIVVMFLLCQMAGISLRTLLRLKESLETAGPGPVGETFRTLSYTENQPEEPGELFLNRDIRALLLEEELISPIRETFDLRLKRHVFFCGRNEGY